MTLEEGGAARNDSPSVRRSERVAARMMLHRSSSLGEESDTNHYNTDKDPAWKRLKKQRLASSSSSSRLNSSPSAVINGDDASSSSSSLSLPDSKPQLTFGVLADVQYAPIPDGFSYGGVPRYYRHALEAARHAAQHFQREAVKLVVNLGDIIDGKCQNIKEHGGGGGDHDDDEKEVNGNPGHDAIDEVIQALSAYRHGPVLHTYGNHELYNLSREDIGRKLNIPFIQEPCGDLVGYHTYKEGKIRFIVLDTYDIAIMGRCAQTSRKRKVAEHILSKNNPNFPGLENSPEGLNGVKKRYVAFNGGIDNPQMEWLQCTLQTAKENGEYVIVLSHQPILPGSSSPVCLVWNYNDVLRVLRRYSSTIIACFAGHAHRGGYKRDEKSGIHFRVFEAVLESPHPIKTYGFVDVHDDRLVVRGLGDCTSAVYDFEHMYDYDDNDDIDEDEERPDMADVVTESSSEASS